MTCTILPSFVSLFVPVCLAACVFVVAAAATARAGDAAAAPPVQDAPVAARSCPPGAPRTLADVLDRVRHSARGDAVTGDIAAAEALALQAGVLPNPELQLELEDFTGSDQYSAFGQSQTTLSVAQPLLLGGRRAQRREVAAREVGAEKARGSAALVRAEVAARQAYVALVAENARVEVTARGEDLARDMLAEARRRAEGGAGSRADVERASVALATTSLQTTTASRRAEAAAARLASFWGAAAGEVACLRLDLAPPAAAPAADARANPLVAIAEAEIEVQRAEVARQRAEATPDVEVAAGVRHLAGPGEVSLVAGVAVELPLFDRNRGNVRAAEERLFAAQARARVAEQEAAARLARLRADVEVARQRATTLGGETIPAAERAFEALRRAWQGGAASSLDVLDAQRSLVALRLERVDALADYHFALAALEGAAGAIDPLLAGVPGDGQED